MHPMITKAFADDRVAEMRRDAAVRRLLRASRLEARAARRVALAAGAAIPVPASPVPAAAAATSGPAAGRPLGGSPVAGSPAAAARPGQPRMRAGWTAAERHAAITGRRPRAAQPRAAQPRAAQPQAVRTREDAPAMAESGCGCSAPR